MSFLYSWYKAGLLYRLSLVIFIILKDSLNYLSRVAAFGSNIGVGLFSTILIGGNFLKNLLLKFACIFGFSARIRSIDNIAVNYKGIYSRIPAAIKGFFD